jgi:hypothetical protein
MNPPRRISMESDAGGRVTSVHHDHVSSLPEPIGAAGQSRIFWSRLNSCANRQPSIQMAPNGKNADKVKPRTSAGSGLKDRSGESRLLWTGGS